MAEFSAESTVRQVLEEHPKGQELLWDHGYDVGEGFVDVLSQYQTLREAARGGRLRNVDGLVDALNQNSSPG
jgi:hypothetical protein